MNTMDTMKDTMKDRDRGNARGKSKEKVALIAYHADCIDGFTAAWITYEALKDMTWEAELLAVTYTDASYREIESKLEGGEFKTLYIVDFSVPMNYLKNYCELVPHFIEVVDHHKTAFERYAEYGDFTLPEYSDPKYSYTRVYLTSKLTITLSEDLSGASLCHSMEGLDKGAKLVSYVQDYDLWKFEFGEDTKYVNQYLRSLPMELDTWSNVASMLETPAGLASILHAGADMLAIFNDKVASYTNSFPTIEIRGQTFAVIDCPVKYVSAAGNAVCDKFPELGCVLYDSHKPIYKLAPRSYSLRSNKNSDIDVSAIAKSYGGGGHKNAAGFTWRGAYFMARLKGLRT